MPPICAQALGPARAACTAACVPFNLFGGAGSITPAMLDCVGFVQNDSSEQKLWDVTANLSGSLFELPGGPLGLAVGVEHRELKGRFDPDPIVAAGFSSDIPAQPTKGGYDVNEAYAEFNAPLLADRPFADLLELNGAVRFSDYSSSGRRRPSRPGSTGSRSRTCACAASGRKASGRRRSASCSARRRASTRNSTIPARTTARAPRTSSNDATVRANCIAAGVPPTAATCRPTRRFR